jgi:hypothetical protein
MRATGDVACDRNIIRFVGQNDSSGRIVEHQFLISVRPETS